MGLLLIGSITAIFSGIASMYFGFKKILDLYPVGQKPQIYEIKYVPIECPYGIQAFDIDRDQLIFTSEMDD